MYSYWLPLVLLAAQVNANCPASLSPGCSCPTISGDLFVQCTSKSISDVTTALNESSLIGEVHTLNLQAYPETVLPIGFAQSYSSLRELRLRNGELTTITPGAFSSSPPITNIDLRWNKLTFLSGEMFAGIPPHSLSQLQLASNELEYLLPDLAPLFLSISQIISLSSNPLKCSCHIQWLADLLKEGNLTTTVVQGAVCVMSDDTLLALNSPTANNFTLCPDLCSIGVHDCTVNETCVWLEGSSTYQCVADSATSSVAPSPTISVSPLTTPTLLTLLPPTPTPTPSQDLSVVVLQSLLMNGELELFAMKINETVSTEMIGPEAINVLVQLLVSATSLPSELSTATAQLLINTVSELLNILEENDLDESSAVILNLIQVLNSIGRSVRLDDGESTTIVSSNIVVVAIAPSINASSWNVSSTLLTANDMEGETFVSIPASIIEDALQGQNLSQCDVRLVVVLLSANTSQLEVNSTVETTEPPLANGVCEWSGSTQQPNDTTLEVNSILVSITLTAAENSNCTLNTSNFTEPILITLHHINSNISQPSCAVLDEQDKSGTSWMSSACRALSTETNFTVCACNHLTTFSLLVNPTGVVTVNQPLLIATKVGLTVSILALLVTVILLFTLKLESNLHHIHRQLALALCLSQMLFLIGVDRTAVPSPDAVCTLIAALLHYLLLCTFAWQLVEGIHLYVFVVKVFYNKKIVWAYYPFAWGVPVIIVAITLGVRFCDYGSLNYCWITNEGGANWAFHGPVLAVIAINIVLLVVVTTVVVRASKRRDPERRVFWWVHKTVQASIVLVPCLGITWVLGILLVVTDNELYRQIVEYLFLVFVTMQGLAIFIVHCLLNTEVRTAFLKAIGCRETAKKQKSLFSYNNKSKIRVFSRRGSLPTTTDVTNVPLENKALHYTVAAPLGTISEETTATQLIVVDEDEDS